MKHDSQYLERKSKQLMAALIDELERVEQEIVEEYEQFMVAENRKASEGA